MDQAPSFIMAWWFAPAASVAAFLVSLVALFLTYRNKRADLEQALVRQRNDINLAFATHRVKGPFAYLVGVKDEELAAFIPKVCLLFLQLNLLNDAYQHRRLLARSALPSYETWAKRILSPWIHSDRHLLDSLKLVYATEDLMPKDFVAWLKVRIPAT